MRVKTESLRLLLSSEKLRKTGSARPRPQGWLRLCEVSEEEEHYKEEKAEQRGDLGEPRRVKRGRAEIWESSEPSDEARLRSKYQYHMR